MSFKDKVCFWIANRIPARIVYWSTIRLISYATTGIYNFREVPALTAMDALKCWGDNNDL